MTDTETWGRRAEDRGEGSSTERIDRADRVLRIMAGMLVILLAAVAVGSLWISWSTSRRVEQIANDGKTAAERNTELLTIDCDEAGNPVPMEEPFVNTEEFLAVFCAQQQERAAEIAEYITQINNATRTQLDVHDQNTFEHHARIEERVTSKKTSIARRPITSPATNAKSSTTTSIQPAPAKPHVATTTTTSCVPYRQERCKDKEKK